MQAHWLRHYWSKALRVRRLPEQQDFRKWKAELHEAYRATEPATHEWHLPDGRTLRVVTQPNPEGGVIYLYDDITEPLTDPPRAAWSVGRKSRFCCSAWSSFRRHCSAFVLWRSMRNAGASWWRFS